MSETLDIPADSSQEIIVQAEDLAELMVRMLMSKGMYECEARIGAARLIEADLRGIHSHGSRSIWRYLEEMDKGNIDPRATVLTVRETPAIAVLDGGKGLGHVAATKAMQMAIEKARAVGTGTVAICRGQHYGAASVYALMAIEAGMIGYTTTSTGMATVAAYGSRKPATANNAIAWGVPTRSGAPFVLDMACAISSWGKVESLKLYGRPIPAGWALDGDGNPTVDPRAAKTLLPFAGARGYGMAFLSSVLAGSLVGGRMPLHKGTNVAADGSEHFFYAIDVQQFVELDRFYAEVDSTMAAIRGLAPVDGFDAVRLPGDLEWERSSRWKRDGIPLHRDHVQKLEELAAGMKLSVPWRKAS
jgi:ureidoglycolate dehydrogenase (NAD+)